MDKAFWKKIKLSFLTLSSIGLLAACGMLDNTPDMGGDEAPVEEPADNEEMPPGGGEDGSENDEEMPPGGSEDGSENGGEEAPGGGDDGSESETTDN